MTQAQKPIEILDAQTGLKNDLIHKDNVKLHYQSCKSLLSLQDDETNLKKYEILKNETFDYFKRQVGPLNNIDIIKQLIADVEFVFNGDKSSGVQKQQLVYDSFLQYLYQIPNINYDTYTKSNIINLIEEIFRSNKKNLIKICLDFHPGLKTIRNRGCMH